MHRHLFKVPKFRFKGRNLKNFRKVVLVDSLVTKHKVKLNSRLYPLITHRFVPMRNSKYQTQSQLQVDP